MCARPSTIEVQGSFIQVYRQLSHYCHFLSRNKWDGEELAQEAICKAIAYYDDKDQWNISLLKKIAYHVWIDQKRRHQHELMEIPIDLASEEKGDKEEIEFLVERLQSKMTSKQLLIFILKDVFRYRLIEIAEYFHMSETGVKATLYRARKHLEKMDQDKLESYDHTRANKKLVSIITQSIYLDDPSRIIKLIPVLYPNNQPKCKHHIFTPPTNILSMAA
ncbi:sigma factor-like helix-turn-helix DNA-binding protein [Gracilibacillus dipsosauri]|uniref:RNA polymerase sigma factor 70 region 4 type 2 domain-containing protein n=1 Tax=Gracilibacillus dipsosauri TaxID=178340 RepID=A0A317L346_9BACI|nr:sigma factor-like helix-turn-helix DNA-binding protein [Gracilibacillus dipsosauri]PWU70301.1 hypothetical protein DLJ74_00205 [Gracilibacillus dipsosauri]